MTATFVNLKTAGRFMIVALFFILVLHQQSDFGHAETPAVVRPKPLVTEKNIPSVQMLQPGFTIRELPVKLSNINNIEYAPDGRLFAAGYDGRVHLLRDTNGDGLEDSVTTFHDKKSDDYPLGIAFHKGSLYVCRRHHITRHRDTNGDGVPDTDEIAATGWKSEVIDRDPLYVHRRVDDALGLAIAPDGTFYISMGAANFGNAYLLDSTGKPHYNLAHPRGSVLKISADGKERDIIATGLRFVVSMGINRHGDLFAADQEGATWLPNGNPFDELLHIQQGRHYGFPPRHPKYLPEVIDEPSVCDYGPQHQSTCGFRINEPGRWSKVFGPDHWKDAAIVTGESRGRLYLTRLIKTAAGYVAHNQTMGSIGMLPIDVAISPAGDLIVACHSGPPDWGTGPAGEGKLFKISFQKKTDPMPLFTLPLSPTETQIHFDRPLDPSNWKNLTSRSRLDGGLYVSEGDRFERFRPGYEVVKAQMATPRYEYPIFSAGLSNDGRTILLRHAPRMDAFPYAITLPYPEVKEGEKLQRAEGIDLGLSLNGVEVAWNSSDGQQSWSGWLPHLDTTVNNHFLSNSFLHEPLLKGAKTGGKLTLRGQLNLWSMLHPAVQVISKLDYTYPPEKVTVVFRSKNRLELSSEKNVSITMGSESVRLEISPEKGQLVPITLTMQSDKEPLKLEVSWHTAEDTRPRALPLHRILVPWAVNPRDKPAELVRKEIPEIAGGNWENGKKVFLGEKAVCAKCHKINGEGSLIGPDLSNLIHRDYESVLRDIREPSAAINPDYLAYVITIKNGKSLTGVLNGSSANELRVADQNGATTTVPRDQVEEVTPSKTSLMPDKLLDRLSDQERKDLLKFLLTKGATK